MAHGDSLPEESTRPKVVLRKLTDSEKAFRAAALAADRIDLDADIKLMAREFLKLRSAQPMASAPRDGTKFLAYLYRERDDENASFGEWREIFYRPYEAMKGWHTPWHAGDPFDSHSGGPAPEHFGEDVPIAWLPLPTRPRL